MKGQPSIELGEVGGQLIDDCDLRSRRGLQAGGSDRPAGAWPTCRSIMRGAGGAGYAGALGLRFQNKPAAWPHLQNAALLHLQRGGLLVVD